MDSPKTRKLLRKYADGECTEQTYQELLSTLVKCDPPVSVHLKDLIEAVTVKDQFKPASEWVSIFKALASASPVCALIPFTAEVHGLITALVNCEPIKNDPCQLQRLAEAVPVVFNLVMALDQDQFCPQFRAILGDLLELSKLPFQTATTNQQCSFTTDKDAASVDSPIAFFPALPVRRSRGVYKADKPGQKEHRKCHKKGKGQRTLLPGIFTVYCQHGMHTCLLQS